MRLVGRLFQGSILCTMVIVIFLFIIILFDVIFQILRQKLYFLSFVDHSSLLRMLRQTEMYCGRAEYNSSGYNVFSSKTQKFSLRFKSILYSSAVVLFLICSLKVIQHDVVKLWFCSLKYLHSKIEACYLVSLL